jgi:nitric oxide reductase large subunit
LISHRSVREQVPRRSRFQFIIWDLLMSDVDYSQEYPYEGQI